MLLIAEGEFPGGRCFLLIFLAGSSGKIQGTMDRITQWGLQQKVHIWSAHYNQNLNVTSSREAETDHLKVGKMNTDMLFVLVVVGFEPITNYRLSHW